MKKLYSLLLGIVISSMATFAQTVVYVPAQPITVIHPTTVVHPTTVIHPTTVVVQPSPSVVYVQHPTVVYTPQVYTPVYVTPPPPVIVRPFFSIGFGIGFGHHHHGWRHH